MPFSLLRRGSRRPRGQHRIRNRPVQRRHADSLARRLVRLLAAVTVDPAQRISQLDIFEPLDRQNLLTGWNDTAAEISGGTLPDVFQAQVARTPDACALVTGTSRLSFAELNARANQLAHYLIGQRIGPEQVVAVALPRNADMVIVLLGILKAGAAYLPIDEEYPAERAEFLLRDARPALVITTADHPGTSRTRSDCRSCSLASRWKTRSRPSAALSPLGPAARGGEAAGIT